MKVIKRYSYTAEQQAELITESNEERQYADEDGSITFEMNEKQLDNNIVYVNDNYREITFSLSKEGEAYNSLSVVTLITSDVIALQMFSGEDPKDWNLKIKFTDRDTDRTVKEVTIPDEELLISPEDWEE